jgi:hypothetical protein
MGTGLGGGGGKGWAFSIKQGKNKITVINNPLAQETLIP